MLRLAAAVVLTAALAPLPRAQADPLASAPPLSIQAVGPTVVPATGGTITYEATVANTSSAPQSFEAWIEAALPDGTPFGPLHGPRLLTLGPGDQVSGTFTDPVPAGAPPGTYTVALVVGSFPGTVTDSTGFTFHKEAPPGRSDDPLVSESTAAGSAPGFFHAITGEDLGLTVAPNPARDRARLAFDLPAPGPVRLVLHDALGRPVAVLAEADLAAGPHSVGADLTAMAPGVYVARLATAGGVATRRLVVTR